MHHAAKKVFIDRSPRYSSCRRGERFRGGFAAGAFGWISADGRADLGVVIRSLMTAGDGRYVLGTGGGITVRSEVDDEWAEAQWKAERLLAALASWPRDA